MITRYDPLREPDPAEWSVVDEEQRTELVRRFHKRARIILPNERAHASLHVVVENQVAMGDETPVAATVNRLVREGLDRHEAIHAVASVLATHVWEKLKTREASFSKYYDEVTRLTAREWLRSSRG